MSHTVRYYGTREEKWAKGVEDTIWYLGDFADKVLATLRQVLNDPEMTVRQKIRTFYLCLEFAGVRGLPAKAMLHKMWKER